MLEKESREIELWLCVAVIQWISSNHCDIGNTGLQQKYNCVCRECKREGKEKIFLSMSTLEDTPKLWKPLYSSISVSLSIPRFHSHPSFLLCGSWQANLNLFRCDITQQLYSCSGASLSGSPAPAPALVRLPAGKPARSSGCYTHSTV